MEKTLGSGWIISATVSECVLNIMFSLIGRFLLFLYVYNIYSKNLCKTATQKRPKIGFQGYVLLNAGQKFCRMLQGEHSATLLTFIKLPPVIKIFVLSIFEWPFYTDFTVCLKQCTVSPFITLCLGSIGMDLVISEQLNGQFY